MTNKRDNKSPISLYTIPKLEDTYQNGKKLSINKINRNINIDKETLDDFEDPNICRICFSEKLEVNNKVELGCGHKFCQKYYKSYND